jgi:hypothetical protein
MLSRVADSLYWMSRYIERAEDNARIADVNLQLLLDLSNQQEADPQQQWDPIISSLEGNELFTSLYETPDGKAVVDFVSLQKKNPNSIYSCLSHARENARTTREQISSEMWEQINRLYLFVKSESARKLVRSSPYEFFKRIIAGSGRLHLAHPGREVSHSSAFRRNRGRQCRYHSMDVGPEVLQRTRGLPENLRRAGRSLESGRIRHHSFLFSAFDPFLCGLFRRGFTQHLGHE